MIKRCISFKDDTVKKLDAFVEVEKNTSKSALVDKAVNFYIDYLTNKEGGEFLSREIKSVLKSDLNSLEKRMGNRIAKLLSELTIQTGITQRILNESLDIEDNDLARYRLETVNEIKNNQAAIKYEKLRE